MASDFSVAWHGIVGSKVYTKQHKNHAKDFLNFLMFPLKVGRNFG
jgi:hypothetical protein